MCSKTAIVVIEHCAWLVPGPKQRMYLLNLWPCSHLTFKAPTPKNGQTHSNNEIFQSLWGWDTFTPN